MNGKRIWYGICCVYWYIAGRIIAWLHFDSNYIAGRHFETWHSVGWRWVVNDYKSCRRIKRNQDVPFPVSPLIQISKAGNIVFDPDDLNNFQTEGCYFQAFGKITIGKGTWIAPNVGLITSNHSIEDLTQHDAPLPITIGEKCWIGMNAVVLPGVVLGNHTVVAAGAVVTKSFPDGNCIVGGGVPATVLRKI